MTTSINIEWRHLDVDGHTCERCADTGVQARQAVAALRSQCGPHGIAVQWRDTILTPEELEQSNLLLINGHPIESLLSDTYAGRSDCPSCGALLGEDVQCRTLERGIQALDSIPESLIVEAACRAVRCCSTAG